MKSILGILAGTLVPALVAAHAGPPFPILSDQQVGPYVVSVWTDPDIGIGVFYVILEPRSGEPFTGATRVQVAVQPDSGRLPETVVTAERQPQPPGERHFARVPFEHGGLWRVRILIEGSKGGGELKSEVEATPDGEIGPIGLLVYAVPFVAVGFLWLKAALRRRRLEG